MPDENAGQTTATETAPAPAVAPAAPAEPTEADIFEANRAESDAGLEKIVDELKSHAGGDADSVADEDAPAKTESREGDAEPETETETDDAPAPVEIDQALLAEGAALGLEADDMQALGADALRKMVDRIDSRFVKPEPKKAEADEGKETAPETGPDSADTELTAKLNPEYHEKDLIDELNRGYKVIEGLQKKVDAIDSYFKAEQTRIATDEFDTFITGLGSEWEEVVGKGATEGLDANSPEYAARCDIVKHAQIISEGYLKHGIKLPKDKSQLWHKGLRASHGDKLTEMTKRGMRNRAQKQLKGASPTATKTKPLTESGDDDAVKWLGEKLKEIKFGENPPLE